jgi:hypothetical protein
MVECILIYKVQRYSKYVISINVVMYRMIFKINLLGGPISKVIIGAYSTRPETQESYRFCPTEDLRLVHSIIG